MRPRPLRRHRLEALGPQPAVGEGEVDRLLGNDLLGDFGGPCHVLDDLAIPVARLEVHAGIDLGRVLAQDLLDPADVLEDGLPIFDVYGAQVEDAGGDNRQVARVRHPRLLGRDIGRGARGLEQGGDQHGRAG